MHAQRAIPFQSIMGHLEVFRALAAFLFFYGSFHFFSWSNRRVPLFPWGIPLFSRRKAERKVERGFCLKTWISLLKGLIPLFRQAFHFFPPGPAGTLVEAPSAVFVNRQTGIRFKNGQVVPEDTAKWQRKTRSRPPKTQRL